MQFLLLIAGLLLILREAVVAKLLGVALLGVAALWLISGFRSVSPENVARIAEIRRDRMSDGLRRLVDDDRYFRKDGDDFIFTCPHCDANLKLVYHPERMGRIRCRGCRHFVFWMQIDETGTWRTMPEYFEMVRAPVSGSPAKIWAYFTERFTYDNAKIRNDDPTWQSSPYTTRTMKGVCRESASTLADWFQSSGYDGIVASGIVTWTSENGGRHAWTVLREEGVDYVLESTGPSEFSRLKTPPRAEVMTEYFPNAYFDPDGCYGITDESDRLTDYRDDSRLYPILSKKL